MYTLIDFSTSIIVTCLDELLHTDEHPFCDDETCPCRDEMAELTEQAELAMCQSCKMMVDPDSLKAHVCPSR